MAWAAPDTFMLEFLPKGRFHSLVWEEAAMRGARVHVLPLESLGDAHSMEPPPAAVATALREHLGTPPTHQGPLPHSDWDLAELTRRRR